MKVAIVGKTRMGEKMVCVGGMSLDGIQSFRLMSKPGSNWPSDVPFKVGQIWDMSLERLSGLKPPHVEDAHVIKMTSAGACSNLPAIIQASPLLWSGPLENIFDRTLRTTSAGRGYVEEGNNLPTRSTGFWIADRDLQRKDVDDKPFFFIPPGTGWMAVGAPTMVKYVGFDPPSVTIPTGAIVRFSLAKWWQPKDVEVPPRCYLQLSGWFK